MPKHPYEPPTFVDRVAGELGERLCKFASFTNHFLNESEGVIIIGLSDGTDYWAVTTSDNLRDQRETVGRVLFKLGAAMLQDLMTESDGN